MNSLILTMAVVGLAVGQLCIIGVLYNLATIVRRLTAIATNAADDE